MGHRLTHASCEMQICATRKILWRDRYDSGTGRAARVCASAVTLQYAVHSAPHYVGRGGWGLGATGPERPDADLSKSSCETKASVNRHSSAAESARASVDVAQPARGDHLGGNLSRLGGRVALRQVGGKVWGDLVRRCGARRDATAEAHAMNGEATRQRGGRLRGRVWPRLWGKQAGRHGRWRVAHAQGVAACRVGHQPPAAPTRRPAGPTAAGQDDARGSVAAAAGAGAERAPAARSAQPGGTGGTGGRD